MTSETDSRRAEGEVEGAAGAGEGVGRVCWGRESWKDPFGEGREGEGTPPAGPDDDDACGNGGTASEDDISKRALAAPDEAAKRNSGRAGQPMMGHRARARKREERPGPREQNAPINEKRVAFDSLKINAVLKDISGGYTKSSEERGRIALVSPVCRLQC